MVLKVKKRIIKVVAIFDMTEIPEDMITSNEKVKEMVEKDIIEEFGWDDGYCGVEVKVVDVP